MMKDRRNAIKLALLTLLACVTCAGLALLAVNLSPRLLPALLGLTRVGPLASALPSDPIPLISAGSPLDHVELLLPPYLPQPLNLTPADLGDGTITGDATTPGASAYTLSLDEAALNALLQRHFFPDGTGDRYRDLWIDLQPGGLILYADLDLGLLAADGPAAAPRERDGPDPHRAGLGRRTLRPPRRGLFGPGD
ncbi:MAG: hypothetical protein U9R15_08765, partial [Chloroflexota bacterium]|nr:hypothetical protein [Chloroflexota bacterium]